MKKLSLFLGMALAASLSLTNCTEKIEGPIAPATPAGIPFEISADISTKTTNNELATQWAEGDAINLFHAVAGKTDYVSDNDFKLDATREGVFTGNLSSELDASKSYDWYAIYPYNKNVTTPAATNKGYIFLGQTATKGFRTIQEGNDLKSHLCGTALPLYGVAKGLASDVKPEIVMNNLASVVAVKVKNTTTEPLVVKSVSFTSTEDIVGGYFVNFTGENVVYTGSGNDFVSSTASLTVNNGEAIAPNSEATFYIPIKPHSVKTGSILKISVNGYEKPLTLPKDVTFTAGSIKTLAFNFDKVVVDYVTIPWTEDFSGDLSLYTLVNGGSETKTYDQALAKGTAPELLISKQGGSFSAKVKADAGNYLLTFKTNKPDNLTVLSSDASVTVVKESATEYLLTVLEGGCTFTLTIKNTRTGEKDNARIDDISLVADTAVRVPVITVDKTTVSAKPEGDIVTLTYSIKYPATGATIAAASTETWVNGFDYGTAGEITFAVDANEGEARTATVTLSYPGAEDVAVTVSQSAKGAVEPVTIIVDASDFSGTDATTSDTDHTFGGVTFTYSKGAKKQAVVKDAKNAFSANDAIFIGKDGAYIYNKTAIPGVITKFEIYSNKGASAKVEVGINFSNSAISKYNANAANTYTAKLATVDKVYDCSASLPKDAKYFWYQVTNNYNSQVQFKITYIPEN